MTTVADLNAGKLLPIRGHLLIAYSPAIVSREMMKMVCTALFDTGFIVVSCFEVHAHEWLRIWSLDHLAELQPDEFEKIIREAGDEGKGKWR